MHDSTNAPLTDQPLSLLLATWFERRVHDTVPFASAGASNCTLYERRMYGLELIDPEGLEHDLPNAARVTFVGTDALPVELASFDAFAMVEYEWREVSSNQPLRPFGYAQRRRARVVSVGLLGSLATVVRFEHQPELVLCSVAA